MLCNSLFCIFLNTPLLQPQSMMFPGLHPMAMMSTSNMGYTARGSGFPSGVYGSGPSPYPSMYPGGLPSQSGSQAGASGDSQVLHCFSYLSFRV